MQGCLATNKSREGTRRTRGIFANLHANSRQIVLADLQKFPSQKALAELHEIRESLRFAKVPLADVHEFVNLSDLQKSPLQIYMKFVNLQICKSHPRRFI